MTKNGKIISEYFSNPEGFRVVKKAKGETTHYVFQGTEPIFEKKISTGKTKSYVYALGKYLARIDGVIGDPEAKKYFYHTDYAGSIRVITDQAGEVVYNADYLAFGSQYSKDGDFEELHGFTGKEFDPDIGLYYFNARWMDPDTGRFLSEDPVGQGPNPYSYCGNNPVMRVDPTGKVWWWLAGAILGGLDSYLCGGDFMQGFVMGAITGMIGEGVNTFVSSAWGSTLKTFGSYVVSGAIAGGIMGEMSGEGFWEGAKFGAISGAIAVGVNKYFGEYAKKSMRNKVITRSFEGGLNSVARGDDANPLYLVLNAIIFTWESIKENALGIKNVSFNQYDIEQAKAEYIVAAEAYEKAKLSGDLDQINTAATRFNNALDRLLIASGYSQYNHTTTSFEPSKPVSDGGYIHVNVDPEIVIKAAELGNELGATSMRITEGFRTREEYYKLPGYENKPANAYRYNFHCQGIALDVTYYKADGLAINKFEAAMTARNIGIPGVSIYSNKTIIHIDLRPEPKNLFDYRTVKGFTATGVIE